MSFANSLVHRIAVAAASATLTAFPLVALAQPIPSYAIPPSREATIRGTITGFNGAYTVYVRDVRGYTDNVSMHQGTIINPTGIRLQEGMRVTIYGYANGPTFDANRIDTPYPPQYVYYQQWAPYWYGYGPYWYGRPYWGWGGWGWWRWR